MVQKMQQFFRESRGRLSDDVISALTRATVECAADFSEICTLVREKHDKLSPDELYEHVEFLVKWFLTKHPNTDKLILSHLLERIFGTPGVVKVYMATMELDGTIVRTGDGISGNGSYSSPMPAPPKEAQ